MKDLKIDYSLYPEIPNSHEIIVTATMSAGKSTFINALLGRNLLPTATRACTAKLYRIIDIDGKKDFTCRCYDKDNNLVETIENVTKKCMNGINCDERFHKIDLYGDIPYIESKEKTLVIVDTPGTNNSQDSTHHDITLQILNEKKEVTFLYIFDSCYLTTSDGDSLLRQISEIKSKDNNKDKFLFLLNKAEEIMYDPEENLSNYMKKTVTILEGVNITNSKIFPISAKHALLASTKEEGSKRYKRDLESYFNDFYMKKYSLHRKGYKIARKNLDTLAQEIRSHKKLQQRHKMMRVYSGIRGVELTIEGSLNKK